MARYFLQLSYNGSAYHGWQIQKNSHLTVQQVIEEKMALLLKEKVNLVGCGRTDTGVHARNFMAHFDTEQVDFVETKKLWLYKFNNILPQDIVIHDLFPVVPNAHARYNAYERVYFYYLSLKKNPFREAFSWRVYEDLDFDLMNEAAQILLEYKDFSSFSKSHTQNKTNTCHVNTALWQQSDRDEWRFSIRSNRFLRGMVRSVVGTLVMVGKHKLNLQDVRDIIEARNRAKAGGNAPAKALFLTGIKYPKDIFIGNSK